MQKRILNLAAALLLSLTPVIVGCDKLGGGPSGDSLEGRIDKHCEEIMASGKQVEAREWFKAPAHVLFKEDPKQVVGYVEDFYSAGAPRVLIGDMEDHEGKQFAGCLIVILPKDAAVRAKLFKLSDRVGVQFQEDPVSDKGQKYLYFSFD